MGTDHQGGWYEGGLMVTAPPRQPPLQVTRPKVAPPLNAYDTHAHVLGPADRLPPRDGAWSTCRDHLSRQAPDYPDARPFHETLVRANSELLIWGSDWRHPRVQGEMTDERHLFELQKWTSDDRATADPC